MTALVLAASLAAAAPAASSKWPPAPREGSSPAAPAAEPRTAGAWLARGHASFRAGDAEKALAAYERAAKLEPRRLEAWLNAAVVLEELGRRKDAVPRYRRAAELSVEPDVLSGYGWAQWRAGDLQGAATTFALALSRAPDHALAHLGAARVDLDLRLPREALAHLDRAAASAPLLGLVPFYQGRAYELLDERAKAVEAYRQAVLTDSWFNEGREALGRAYVHRQDYPAAWRQYARALEAEPHSRRWKGLLERLRPLLARAPEPLRAAAAAQPLPEILDALPAARKTPNIRVGLLTTPAGKPRARQVLVFSATSDFDIIDARSGRRLARGAAGDAWTARVVRLKKRSAIALISPGGEALAPRADPVLVRPLDATRGVVALDYAPARGLTPEGAGRLVRGALELALRRRQLRLVNIVDLENYTHGVLSAEMPIKSPLEALKAQAVLARGHALFIKRNHPHRHRRDGYEVCDEQHCQVYAGARAESRRSREVVEATAGRVVMYHGRVAHVVYASNCGGHTQSGHDVKGWANLPYLVGVPDGPEPAPESPWALRRWLLSYPPAFCKPSNEVHPSHFRWTRVIPVKDLEEKLHRRLRIGRLLALRPLRRSRSGNVNSLLIAGSRRKVKIDSELLIRNLLGLGSLRSTLFVIDVEYDATGKPETLVFFGGGWGHGVGLCQSGAMGRAETGQDYEQIIRAYYNGAEIGTIGY